jgi:hypothetical protein
MPATDPLRQEPSIPLEVRFINRINTALGGLAERPWVLCLVALALNALVQPYTGLIHDSRLYALQVANRVEGGAFNNDLFLAYGSQDKYSLFSHLAAPLAAVFGIPVTFFALYLLARVLFLYGLTRFFLQLFGTSGLAALAVLVLAVDPITFGGYAVFQVNEPFLTPRLPACGFTLLGLAVLLEGHWLRASLYFFLGCLLHPLMAIVGFPLLLGWAVVRRWPEHGLLALAALSLTGCLVILGIPALAYRIFGRVDAEWLEQVRLVTTFNFPWNWREVDYRRTIGILLIVGVAAALWRNTQPARANFLGLVILLAVGGLLATAVASEMGYRILFQGQPYRALWLLHLVAMPCLLQLLAWAWATQSDLYRCLVLALAAVMVMISGVWDEWIFPIFLIPVAVFWFRGLGSQARDPHWISHSLAASLGVGMFAWGIFRLGLLTTSVERFAGRFDPLEYLYVLWYCLGVMVFVVVVLLALVGLGGWVSRSPGRVALTALGTFLLLHGLCFGITQTEWYCESYTSQGPNTRFVAEFLAQRHPAGKPPTVYWATGRLELIWLRAHSCVYFDFVQLAGLLYSQETARESYRRAVLVGPFEMERFNRVKSTYPEFWQNALEKLYRLGADEKPPDVADLRRLAQERGLDYVVLDIDLGYPPTASNGKVHIYDCRELRASAAAPRP